ncbi:YdcF family protein [Nocardia sp. CA2R105]|uniref:YdcF family protein n=1 Tax=Nocardia coffeae TaxID=2873381 RepID=UPI001CA623F9|nr:YdcF family protein [Nocardia coffeae]MBY8862100.1 YdcF family protein [Nocardia coffeae]
MTVWEPVALLVSGSIAATVGILRVTRDPRRVSTGVLLLAAVVLLGSGIGVVVAGSAPLVVPRPRLAAVATFLPVVIGIVLLANGIAVIRKEGRSPTTLTPVVVGAGLMLLSAGIAVVVVQPAAPTRLTWLTVLCCALGGYFVAHLIAFGGYALLYSNLPDRPQADAVVILGCGLHRGSVTPLLAARLDRGIRAYRTAVDAGALPVVVTCGGQGPDEATSEADAMARYLATHGVHAHCIVRERHSRNTAENIENCVRELAVRGTPRDRIRMTMVTSDFHVLRTAVFTRRLEIDAQVVGARTAGYFIPAAFLREFFAVLVTQYRRTHLIVATGAVVALAAIVVGVVPR